MAGLQVGVMTVVVFFIRKWGVDYLAAYQVVMQITVLALMWPLSAGESVVVITGRTHSDASINLRSLYRAALFVSVGSAVITAVAVLALHGPLLGAFLTGPHTLGIALHLLFAGAALVATGAVANTGFALLRGLKLTRDPMLVLVGTYGVLALGLLLGVYYLTNWHGAALLWSVALAVAVSALCYHLILVRTARYRTDACR